MFEDVGGASYGRDVVHDELAVGGQEVAALVELLDASLVLTVCNHKHAITVPYYLPLLTVTGFILIVNIS